MSRYIDAEALVKYANNQKDKTVDANDIMRFSTADVVEVVRCRECKYGKWKISELDNKTKGYECAIHAVFENDFGDNGYCSYGEREDDE